METEVLTTQKFSAVKGGIRTVPLFLGILLNIQAVCAQYTFDRTVQNDKRQSIDGAQVLLIQNDSIVSMILTDKKGRFHIKEVKSGEYRLNISYMGYTPADENFFMMDKDTKSTFTLLPEMTKTLDDVVIVSNSVKQTATGQTFYLSEAAGNSETPIGHCKKSPGSSPTKHCKV